VYENIAFPLRLKKVDHAEVDRRVREAAETLELTEHLDRKPANLSGGQRQRVAMGRAIVREAQVFLFDEPLSNLDAKLRGQMRTEISRLQKRLGVTTVYVTHDQIEAMTLGDRVCLLRRGIIQQVGTPRELYNSPVNLFVAGFIGSPPMNFIPVGVEPDGLHLGPFGVVGTDAIDLPDLADKKLLIAGLRPEHLEDARLVDEAKRDRGVTVAAPIDVVEWLGDEQVAYVTYEAPAQIREQLNELERELDSESTRTQLVVKLSAASDVREGEEFELWFDPRHMHLFDPANGQNMMIKQPTPA
jgi:multiple sugar transport system ATP-binding protein